MKTLKSHFVLIVVVMTVIVVAYLTLKSFINLNTSCWNTMFDGLIGAAWGVVVTAFLAGIAYWQLSAIGKTTSTEFIHKLKNEFFVEETRILLDHIIDNRIVYKKAIETNCQDIKEATSSTVEMIYFEVDTNKILKDIPEQLKAQLTKKQYYLEVEIDDFLLGHFEDIGLFGLIVGLNG
jgi:hypothetical protein